MSLIILLMLLQMVFNVGKNKTCISVQMCVIYIWGRIENVWNLFYVIFLEFSTLWIKLNCISMCLQEGEERESFLLMQRVVQTASSIFCPQSASYFSLTLSFKSYVLMEAWVCIWNTTPVPKRLGRYGKC